MKKEMKGNLWEIHGLLYLIISYMTPNQWLGWTLFIFGWFSIFRGGQLQNPED